MKRDSSRIVLGVSAFYHDAAAAVVKDGEIVAAVQEERFTRKKHDPGFPVNAINYCLGEAFIRPRDLDAVVFYDNPVLTFDRVVKNFLMTAPSGTDQWQKACRSLLGSKFDIKERLRRVLGEEFRLLFTDHHMSHAASAFYPSPFKDAAIIIADGVGEWATTSLGHGREGRIEILKEIDYPHSLGLLYTAFTTFCGFKANSGEYKLMGLAPYGRPVFADRIREHLVDVKADGSLRLNMEYFGFLDRESMTNERFHSLFGGEPRKPESRITRREMDIAASVQVVLEDAMMKLAGHVKHLTGSRYLVLAGGVALNCVANGKIVKSGLFDHIWAQPAAGDAGGALGAALLVCHQYCEVPRKYSSDGRDLQKGSYLGPQFSHDEVVAFLERRSIPYEVVPDEKERSRLIAQAISDGKIVGYMAGRMEFGPRSLGARSILGDARRPDTQSIMNLKVKYRESFRPFAPSVLRDAAGRYFELEQESPYMLVVAPVREERRLKMDLDKLMPADDDMIPVINHRRSDLPAITHVDYSARVQTVDASEKPDFYNILKAFEELTGCAVVVNTSFNVRGEPIVCSPHEAYQCFMRTDIDLLVIEDCVMWKDRQPKFEESEDWRKQYELD